MLQIRLHGAPCNVRLDNGKVMSGKKAADHLAKTIKATGNSPINFVSCYGAAGGAISNAQMLANKTGCPVKGYTKKSHRYRRVITVMQEKAGYSTRKAL